MTRIPSPGQPKIELAVAIDFTSADTAIDMRKKVAKCYLEAEPFLKGPNGEQLVLRLAEKSEKLKAGLFKFLSKNQHLKPLSVKVETKNFSSRFRGNSTDFASNYDCPTILHETLHWLGLSDEYPEPEFDYGCRILGPKVQLCTIKGTLTAPQKQHVICAICSNLWRRRRGRK